MFSRQLAFCDKVNIYNNFLKDRLVDCSNSLTLNSIKRPCNKTIASITSDITKLPSASKIDFDIHNLPFNSVLPPSSGKICNFPSNINANDVMLGRKNGNFSRKHFCFRILLKEFQPTNLLCQNKVKFLIARIIVLIVRNRGHF